MSENLPKDQPRVLGVRATVDFVVDAEVAGDPVWQEALRKTLVGIGQMANTQASVSVELVVGAPGDVPEFRSLAQERDPDPRLLTRIRELLSPTNSGAPKPLSEMMANALERKGVQTVRDVLALGKWKALGIRTFGEKSMRVLEGAIDSLQLTSAWKDQPEMSDYARLYNGLDEMPVFIAAGQRIGGYGKQHTPQEKHTVQELLDTSVEDLAWIFKKEKPFDPNKALVTDLKDRYEPDYERARRVLQEAQDFAEQFNAAKGNRSTS